MKKLLLLLLCSTFIFAFMPNNEHEKDKEIKKLQEKIIELESSILNHKSNNFTHTNYRGFTHVRPVIEPLSSVVTKGDMFHSEISLGAFNRNDYPQVYIGDYRVNNDGSYELIEPADYLESENGVAKYSVRANRPGKYTYKGFIKSVNERNITYLPFEEEFFVNEKLVIATSTNLYVGIDNPIHISIPGYHPSEISATINNGKLSVINRSSGKYSVRPSKSGNAIIGVYINKDGKRIKMGTIQFMAKAIPG